MPRPRKKHASSEINIKGSVNTGGGDIASGDISKGDVHQIYDSQIVDYGKLFQPVYQSIEHKKAIPQKDRQYLKKTVSEIQTEVEKESSARKAFIERRLRNISKMAPDIFEVILNTIANPIIGLTTLAQKIAQKANVAQPKSNKIVKKKSQ